MYRDEAPEYHYEEDLFEDDEDPFADDGIYCDNCGAKIVHTTAKSGREWTPENIRDYSKIRFGRCLCTECQAAERAKKEGR